MCRYGDTGPYSLSNIYCDLATNNVSTAQKGVPNGPRSQATKDKIGATQKGIPWSAKRRATQDKLTATHIYRPMSQAHKDKISTANKGKKKPPRIQEHIDNLKASQDARWEAYYKKKQSKLKGPMAPLVLVY